MTPTRTASRSAARVAADLGVSPATIRRWYRAWHGPHQARSWQLSPVDELVARAWWTISGGQADNRPLVAELRRLAEDAVRRHPRRWLVLVARDRWAQTFDHHVDAVAATVARVSAGPSLIDLAHPGDGTVPGRRQQDVVVAP
jgi:hypothetical protein